jgi:hypothetical protein
MPMMLLRALVLILVVFALLMVARMIRGVRR